MENYNKSANNILLNFAQNRFSNAIIYQGTKGTMEKCTQSVTGWLYIINMTKVKCTITR